MGGDYGSVANGNVAHNADLTCHLHLLSHAGTSRDSRLCGDHGVFSDHYVVGNLHKIVDLDAFLDPGASKTRAIDRGVGADFHVVVDLHDSELLNFL